MISLSEFKHSPKLKKKQGRSNMSYTAEDVLEYVAEEDVKFIRLAFLDVNGIHRNLSILPAELKKAFNFGIPRLPLVETNKFR